MTEEFKLDHPLPYDFHPQDFYATPAWVTDLLIKHAPPLKITTIYDPCAGDGDLLEVFINCGYRQIQANDIRIDAAERARKKLNVECTHFDFANHGTVTDYYERFCSIVTNPPFSIGPMIAKKCLLTKARYIALLLRVDVIGSENWRRFFTEHRPTKILPITKRPSFTGDGGTDFYNYGWFIWESDRPALDIVPVRPQ